MPCPGQEQLVNRPDRASSRDEPQTLYVPNDPSRKSSGPTKTLEPADKADERIHILGTGSVGSFIAHSLKGIPNAPPVTLLLHRKGYADEWRARREEIKIITDGQEESRSGFDIELAIPPHRRHEKVVSNAEQDRLDNLFREESEGTRRHEQVRGVWDDQALSLNEGPRIRNVIVTVKAPSTVSALHAIKHRLDSESTVLFMQNGMGIVEEVNEKVFSDPSTRPNYLLGINSHGVHSEQIFVATHAGLGTIALGMPVRQTSKTRASMSPDPFAQDYSSPNFDSIDMASSSRYLYRTLLRTPVLAAVGYSPTELLKVQLDKLAVNCVVNPLTALMDCRNGMLLYNMAMSRCMRLILSEVSSVFIRLPELQGLPNINTRYSPERLENMVVSVARKTGQNISSMLGDVRMGMQTEIEYINGYVIKRGEEMGIHAGFNFMLSQLVRGKQQMVRLSEDEELPFVRK